MPQRRVCCTHLHSLVTDESHILIALDGSPLTVGQVEWVARQGARVELTDTARQRLSANRAVIDAALDDGLPHYGINTGFGSLSRTRIPNDELGDLQHNLIRSHAAGIGEPLPDEVVRAMMLLLAASLARGLSGVRPRLVKHLTALLNAGITPIVPSIGSVGASGDLAPLAHVGLVLIGLGHARIADQEMSGADALARHTQFAGACQQLFGDTFGTFVETHDIHAITSPLFSSNRSPCHRCRRASWVTLVT